MTTLRIAIACSCLFLFGCGELERSTPATETSTAVTSLPSKRVYRCEWSPVANSKAKNLGEALRNEEWRAAEDGVCSDEKVFDNLSKVIANLPAYTRQDFPFVGYCEHYLLTDGSGKGLLIGFVCENYGIVVWEAEPDEDGRWMKTDSGTLRGKEEDKAAIRSILSTTKFDPL